MRPHPVLPVAVKSVDACNLEARLEKVKERIRRRAYELYCTRPQNGTALEDWTRAERESNAAPLAGIADEGNDFRITASIPDADAFDLTVHVLPNEIVLEADRNGEIERCKRFHMPAPVDVNRVEAHLDGAELDVVAPKAKAPKARN